MEMLCPLHCDAVAVSRRDETKTIKPIINEAFVASSVDIITGYNDLYCLFMRRVALRHVNITMSAFVIGETTNNKRYSTQLKTRVWIISYGGRESSTRCNFRKHMQIEKAPANQENIFISLTAGAANAHNTTK